MMGFSNCHGFGDGNVKQNPPIYKTKTRLCPKCDLQGLYDRNAVRMVEGMGWGVKWGTGPGKLDWGIEIKLGSGRAKCIIL